MRGAVVIALVLAGLAGCAGPAVQSATGHASRTFLFEPEPGSVARERAPLEGLGDARTLLTDVVTDRLTHRSLRRLAGAPCELEVVAPTVTATEAYLKRVPEDPCRAAIRVVPDK